MSIYGLAPPQRQPAYYKAAGNDGIRGAFLRYLGDSAIASLLLLRQRIVLRMPINPQTPIMPLQLGAVGVLVVLGCLFDSHETGQPFTGDYLTACRFF